MSRRSWFKARPLALATALCLAAGFATTLHASVQNRIAAISTADRTPLQENVSPHVRLATDQGAADPSLLLGNMTLRFGLTPQAQAQLTQLLLQQQQPGSANYHKWLTPEQFADQFGLSASDLSKVTAWLTSQGFKVTGTARSRTFVTFSGTAAQVQQAFATTIHTVTLNGEQHFANLTDPALPSALSGIVTGVTGLNDFRLIPRAKTRLVPAPGTTGNDPLHPQFTSSISGNHFIAPADFYTIYDELPLLNSSVNGSGITIAVMGQTDISLSDVAAFRAASGLTVNAPTIKLYGVDPGTRGADLGEAQLDVEWSGAVAPSAHILYVLGNNVIDDSLTQAIDNNLAPIVTISYGDCESGYGAPSLASFNLLFQQANAQGQTVVGPAGDSGAADCDYQVNIASQGLAVDFPASSPYVTGVGGTMYNEGTGNYWLATNASAYNGSGSAISYIPEMVWNESSSAGLAAGGGGASAFFTKPPWQVGTGVPADFSRDVPDLSFNAAASHDGYLFCSSGVCTNGYRDINSNLDVVGGTSVSTPAFAGILALLEQKLGSKGLGNINPTLYSLANSTYYGNVFHDVTTGSNAVPCASGTPNCPSGGTIGYNAGTGYDLATGWGSVDATNMVNDWALVTPLNSGASQSNSTTTLTAAVPSCAVVGTAIPLTITVASATSGVTSAPSGTIQILVDGVISSSPVALGSGPLSISLSTTTLTSGTHVLTAIYSGSTIYASSKSSTSIDLSSSTAPDFCITGSTTTITVPAGGTAPGVTYTIKSLQNFAGSLTMSATSSSNLNASATFTPTPVTVTAGGTGTTVFTFYAYTTNAGGATPVTLGANRTPTWMTATGGMAFASMLLVLIPLRKRRKLSRGAGLFTVLLLSVGALALSGCGGARATLSSVTNNTTNATPGTYQLTITAASGTTSHSTNLTLVVQ